MSELVIHRGTKYFKYLDPLPLETLNDYFKKHQFLKIKGRNLDGVSELIKHKLTIIEYTSNKKLLGRITYKERKKEGNSDTYYWKFYVIDFMFLTEPSALILHGSIGKMKKIIEGFNDAVNPDDEPDNDSSNGNSDDSSFFDVYGYSQPIGKFVIRKISKMIEASGENILFDPHFKEFRNNSYQRGGEGFYRRDRTSATLDEEFDYLFDLCTYWEPEFHIRNCGGIVSLTNTSPYNMTITSDFAFKFTSGVRKEQLDLFWTSIVIPIIQEDDYSAEEKECADNVKAYLEKIKKSQ